MYRAWTWLVLIGGAVLAIGLLTIRYFVLPDIDRYRPWLEHTVSDAAGQHITIARIEGEWSGYRPSLSLSGIVVFDRQDRPALELKRAHAVLAWRSVVLFGLRLHQLTIEAPALTIRRDRDGHVSVGGFRLDDKTERGGFGDWLLQQSRVEVHDAEVTWIDEERGAPALVLGRVDLRLDNSLRFHRFGIRVVPPSALGAPVHVRGQLRRRGEADAPGLRGRLYLRAELVDLGALSQWVDLPFAVRSGLTDVEAWADLADGRVQQATADVRVAGLTAAGVAGVAPLELAALQGRITYGSLADGHAFGARRVSLRLADGRAMRATTALVRVHARPKIDGIDRLEVAADTLDIAPLMAIAGVMPLDEAARTLLLATRPEGRIEKLALDWAAGTTPKYSVSARFVGLSAQPSGQVPGFRGLTGQLQADQRGGALDLEETPVTLAVPHVMIDPLAFGSLAGRVEWSLQPGRAVVSLNRLRFANADLEGSASGTWQSAPGTPGVIDLSAVLTRAGVSSVPHYLPRILGPETRAWLKTSLEAGEARDVRLRLRGNLARFPFEEAGSNGIFEVVVPVRKVRIAYAPGWPAIDDIAGTLTFRGNRLDAEADGRVLGAALRKTKVAIPDLSSHDPELRVSGSADGPTHEFFRFIEESPLREMIGGASRGRTAQGNGRLALDLVMPLNHSSDAAISGTYRFIDNRIQSDDEIPTLSGVNALLEFSDAGARVRGATATILDNPVRFDVLAERGITTVTAGGRINMARMRRQVASTWLGVVDGEADWKALITARKGKVEVVVDSSLAGLAVNLPAPLGKAAADVRPLHLVRRPRGADQLVQISVGKMLNATLLLGDNGAGIQVRRGAVGIDTEAVLPDQNGIRLTGVLDRIDVDAWLDVLAAHRGEADATVTPILGFDLKANTVEVFGRTLDQVTLRAERHGDLWNGAIGSRQVAGDIDWRSGGAGVLTAHLSRLHIPEATEAAGTSPIEPIGGRDLPAFDVTADSFHLGARDLGALKLVARPAGAIWQLDQLDLKSPEGHLSALGSWRLAGGQPLSQFDVRLQVDDIGGLFRRLKLPEGVKGGKASLEGKVSWAGSPYAIDYPSLAGQLTLDARKGQFTSVEPGIAKLLGVISLQSLPRRISLDFRDIFSKGFAFDQIGGKFDIGAGVMRTADMKMIGSSARVSMKGQVDLGAETQDLEVKVIPSISDSIAVGTAIVNPLAGLAALIVGRALSNPIDNLAAFEYRVTGKWEDPVVRKVLRATAAPASSGQR